MPGASAGACEHANLCEPVISDQEHAWISYLTEVLQPAGVCALIVAALCWVKRWDVFRHAASTVGMYQQLASTPLALVRVLRMQHQVQTQAASSKYLVNGSVGSQELYPSHLHEHVQWIVGIKKTGFWALGTVS